MRKEKKKKKYIYKKKGKEKKEGVGEEKGERGQRLLDGCPTLRRRVPPSVQASTGVHPQVHVRCLSQSSTIVFTT